VKKGCTFFFTFTHALYVLGFSSSILRFLLDQIFPHECKNSSQDWEGIPGFLALWIAE